MIPHEPSQADEDLFVELKWLWSRVDRDLALGGGHPGAAQRKEGSDPSKFGLRRRL